MARDHRSSSSGSSRREKEGATSPSAAWIGEQKKKTCHRLGSWRNGGHSGTHRAASSTAKKEQFRGSHAVAEKKGGAQPRGKASMFKLPYTSFMVSNSWCWFRDGVRCFMLRKVVWLLVSDNYELGVHFEAHQYHIYGGHVAAYMRSCLDSTDSMKGRPVTSSS
ncbi:hypothetical protein Droror1_Dr00019361 [Drosera rotundifolia]